MKIIYKITASIFLLFLMSIGIIYAFNGTKSTKLPWQGSASSLDAIHNVGTTLVGEDRFSLSDSNTIVTDSITGLKWQSYKNTLSADYIENYTVQKNWADAKTYCASLSLGSYGSGSWRLPTLKELNSIVDFSRSPLALDITYFGSQTMYWSSSVYKPSSSSAWIVAMQNGSASSNGKLLGYYVRCVH